MITLPDERNVVAGYIPDMGRPSLPPWIELASANPMFGREVEREQLDTAWDSVITGLRHVVLIGGAPGSGKTRLASEAARAAHEQGAAVVHGLCRPDHDVPFGPFPPMVAELRRVARPDAMSGPGMQLLQAFVNPHLSVDDRFGGRMGLLSAVSSLFADAAGALPLVVVIDDLHWASAATLEMLDAVIRGTAAAPLMLIATFRTTQPEKTPRLVSALAEMYRSPGVVRIELSGVDVDEARQIMTHRSGRAPTAIQARLMHEYTGGNPFLLNEMSRTAFDDHAVPPTVDETIRARLRLLRTPARRLLETASVIGPTTTIDMLEECVEGDSRIIGDLVAWLTDAGFFTRAGNEVGFVHELARQAVIGTIRPSVEVGLHLAVAGALERSPVRDHAALAYHYEAAGGLERAGEEYAAAAHHSATRGAFEEAAAHFEACARMAHSTEAAETSLLEAANQHLRAASFRQARDVYARVTESVDPVRMARAALGFEDASWRPGHLGAEAVAKLRTAAHRLSAAADPVLELQVRSALGRALAFTGLVGEAERIGDEAVADAYRIGTQRVIATTLLNRHLYHADSRGILVEDARRILDLTSGLNDPDLIAQASFILGSTGYALGSRSDWDRARDELANASMVSSQPFLRVAHASSVAARMVSAGALEMATAVTNRMLSEESRFEMEGVDGVHGLMTFMIRRELGLDDVRPHITGDPEREPGTWTPGLMALYTELGLVAPSRRLLGELCTPGSIAAAVGKYEGHLVAFLADAIWLTASKRHASNLYEALEARSGTNLILGHFVAVFGSVDRYLGMLAAVLGRPFDGHFATALAMDQAMGSTLHEVETLARWAQALRRSDRRKSEPLRREALERARVLGSVRLTKMAQPTDGMNTVLTTRETEVLRLLAVGMSNNAIAETLYISVNTAANHVRHILTKTGCANRTEAARYAGEVGLLAD